MSDYLLTGAITNAINMPSITADQAVIMKPWITLAEKLGAFAGQLTETSIKSVEIIYEGHAAELNTRALTQAALAGLLKPNLSDVNMVNAPVVAKERGIQVSEVRRTQHGAYEGYLMLKVTTEKQTREVAGTVFSNGVPRLIQVKGIDMESHFTPHMLYVTNEDKPGFIGKLGTLLGDAKVNIASFNLGRTAPGGDAIALVEVDGAVPESVLAEIRKVSVVKQAKALVF
jgi:D-3-phosphoglycerate dehydrogenase